MKNFEKLLHIGRSMMLYAAILVFVVLVNVLISRAITTYSTGRQFQRFTRVFMMAIKPDIPPSPKNSSRDCKTDYLTLRIPPHISVINENSDFNSMASSNLLNPYSNTLFDISESLKNFSRIEESLGVFMNIGPRVVYITIGNPSFPKRFLGDNYFQRSHISYINY